MNNSETKSLLASLPKVDRILAILENNNDTARLTRAALKEATKETLEKLRTEIISGRIFVLPDFDSLLKDIIAQAEKSQGFGLRPVINATGIMLHTNLGRAPLGEFVAEHIKQTALGYSTLEYDLETGQRGQRGAAVEKLLCKLTGAESAVIVNNNASAVLLALSGLCVGKKVIISRGELVEIGGSFRVPDVIIQGGAILVEIGTTNKARLSDYAGAIDSSTAAILKVHTSNYKIIGFTESVEIQELANLTRQHKIPLIYDLGSGALLDFGKNEPTVQSSLAQGADLVCISGDKLLGGSQAGIILGSSAFLDILKSHPLYRALRADKLALAALEAILRLYNDSLQERIPLISMFQQDLGTLRAKADNLFDKIGNVQHVEIEIIKTESPVGGGSIPGEYFPSFAISLNPKKISATQLESRLRNQKTPIIGRIWRDMVLLDIRTIDSQQFDIISQAISEVFDE